jgi:hypothetical protein
VRYLFAAALQLQLKQKDQKAASKKIFMENRINRLIWEAKKSGKPVNPWAICTTSVGREDKAKYERCVKDIKKKSPIKEGNINEVGGYDDPGMYAKHAEAYFGNIKEKYNEVVMALQFLANLSPEILDDPLRAGVEKFLDSVEGPLKEFAKIAIEAEKRQSPHFKGGRPTPRQEE